MTYERVVVTVKATGPDPMKHVPVEIAWWNLATSERGSFVPRHDVLGALGGCDLATINAIGYTTRIAQADQDIQGSHASLLAAALNDAILVSTSPLVDNLLLRRMFNHYVHDLGRMYDQPEWLDVMDVGAYAAGVLGLDTLPDLATICEYTGIPLEAAHTAETDTDATGRAMLRLAELAEAAKDRRAIPSHVPAAEELTAALSARLTRVMYDLVTFTGDSDDSSYTVDTDLASREAHEVYAPVIRGLMGEIERNGRTTREMAQAATRAAIEYQAKLDEIRTAPPDTDQQEQIRAAAVAWLSANDRADVLGDTLVTLVGPWLAGPASLIADQQAELETLRTELAEKQASREDWAAEAMRLELTPATPWDQLVVPNTELSIGPDQESAVAVGSDAVVIGPAHAAHVVAAIAATPFPACPNSWCDHSSGVHDVEDHGDPIPMCCIEGCGCGHPPIGWRRTVPMQAFASGETVPAGVDVMDSYGQLYPSGRSAWMTNAPVVGIVSSAPTHSAQPVSERKGHQDIADVVEPVDEGGCPNTPGCLHPRTAHGIDTADDAIPVCWTDGCPDCPCGCSCGQPPTGFRRKPGQRVWQKGDTIPAGAYAMDTDGHVWPDPRPASADWINYSLGTLVEVERVPDRVEPVDEVLPGVTEDAVAEPVEVTG